MSRRRKGVSKRVLSAVLSAAMVATTIPAMSITASAESAEGNIELSRQVAADGMVLLENRDEALPVQQGTTVAMFGRAMIDYTRGGGGSGATNVDYTRNILQGMQIKEEEGKISLYQPLVDFYTEQVTTNGIKNDAQIDVTDEMMDAAAAAADTAVVTIGRYSSEGSDRSATKGDYYLSDAEEELITRVAEKFDKVIVVLNVGAVTDTSWINDIPGVDAVLVGWQAGMEGGLATADVLVGDVNPSGKLVDTWAKSYEDYPSAETFNESTGYVNYTEDIYVGYRYFETFDPDYEKVNYPFGYGLSYTDFKISEVTVDFDGDALTGTANVSATVTNTGDMAGKEVVQVYFSAPQAGEGEAKMSKPAKELAAFDKTDLLEPGESETLEMSFAISDMSSYDDIGETGHKSAYVMEAGDYDIYVGDSIKDAGEKGVRGRYTQDETVVTEQLTEKLAPKQLPERLMADGQYHQIEVAPEFDPHHTIAAEGQTIVQSEAFIDGDVTVEGFYDDNFERLNCIAMMNAKDKYAEYEITVEEAGTYSVTMRYANGNAQLNNCFKVLVDGVAQPGIRFNAPQTGDGSGKSEWYNFADGEPFYVYLPEGTHTLRLVANGNNPNYDYMVFEKSDVEISAHQPVSATEPTKIEAENFEFSGGTDTTNYVRTESFTVGDYNGVCLAYMNHVNNWVSYYLDVEEAGDYDLYFNVANGRAGFDWDVGVDVDGAAVEGDTLTVPQTGDGDGASEWYNFEDVGPVTVTLPQGHCVLKFTCSVKDKYPNIDYITITKAAESGPSTAIAPTAMRAKAVTVNAASEDPEEDEKIMLLDVYEGKATMDEFLDQLTDEQLINMMGGQPNTGVANTGGMGNLMEYGIPNIMTADGPQGIRIGVNCTAWPIGTLQACTWDVDLVQRVGKAAAVEARTNGIDIWLAPGMNIHRDPLCGRNFEYYSEDPLVAGKMAAALTKGCQSEDVAISLKHFAANNKETNRSSSDSRVSERALREIYLKGFEIAVKEADPWTIMSSYNLINGTETSENAELLTDILRGEWGFNGLVETDWGNNSNHAFELKAGNDVKMSSGSPSTLQSALEKGFITRDDLERSAERLMNLVMKVNTFQNKIVNPITVDIGDNTTFKAAENILWSQTVKAEATKDDGGGNNLGYCDAGAWAEYHINVLTSGSYNLSARTASSAGSGAFNVLVDGETVASFDVPNTGAYQNWVTQGPQQINLEAGEHTMRIEWTESGSNLNWLLFERTGELATEHALTVTFPATVELSVGGESQTIANLLGKYTANVMGGDALDLAFAPRVEGREIAGVTVNSEAIAEDSFDAAEYVYSAAMPNADTTIELGFTVVDKQNLRAAIEIAEGRANEAAEAVESVQEKYEAALQAAKDVEAKKTATQNEINTAWSDLIDALHYLSFVAGDKSQLEIPMEIAESINRDLFTPDSLKALDEAYAAAEDLLDDEEVLEADITEAVDALYDAIYGLVYRADVTELEALVNKGDGIVENADQYIQNDAWTSFETVLAEAKTVLEDANATQDAVDTAAEDLAAAISALRLIPDKDALEALIGEAEAINTNKYTAKSVATMKAALSTAKAVLNDAEATEEEVADAVEALENSIDGLVEKSTSTSSKGSTSANVGNAYGAAGVVSASQSVAANAYVVSDTTVNFTLKRGSAYCFKMTVVNGNAMTPGFTVGNGDVLKTQFVAKIGNDYYYRVYAIGTPGQSTGVYTTLPGQNAVKHCTVTIG